MFVTCFWRVTCREGRVEQEGGFRGFYCIPKATDGAGGLGVAGVAVVETADTVRTWACCEGVDDRICWWLECGTSEKRMIRDDSRSLA